MKKHLLPLILGLLSLAACSASSGTALTVANAKTYLRDPTTTSATPTQKSAGVYECSFTIDAIKNGLTSDVKGAVTLTATPTEYRIMVSGTESHSKTLDPIKNISGTFASKSSSGSDGGTYYISCDGTFAITVTLDEGFDYVNSVTISDFTYTAISGNAETGA
jgi:hypothetical protein